MKYLESNQVDTVRCFACTRVILNWNNLTMGHGPTFVYWTTKSRDRLMKHTDFRMKIFVHNCVDSVVTVFTVQADIDSDTVELFDFGDWFLFWD